MSNTSNLKRHRVSVRALADFCQQQGDLISSFRPGPSAFEGRETHQLTQARRDDRYQSEVALSLEWQAKNYCLTISGRADLVSPTGLEEIKTTRIPADEIPETIKALHLSQAKIYAAIYLLSEQELAVIDVSVIYVHAQTQQEWVLKYQFHYSELIDFLCSLCSEYDHWLTLLNRQQLRRSQFIEQLSFPFSNMRASQRQMAEDVYRSCCTGKNLCVEAPTGTGKTLASLFPALKAFDKANIQSLFFLTMKTTGRIAAQATLEQLDPNKELAVVTLSAKHRLCLAPDSVCDGQHCEYAQDYFGKRQQVRAQLFSRQHWQENELIALAQQIKICPYYLSQDWAIWSDVVIADVNYIYDTTAVQPYLLKEIDNHATLLIDESHNLIDRGRMMFSTEFSGQLLQRLLSATPKTMRKHLIKIQSELRKICADKDARFSDEIPDKLNQCAREFISHSASLLREHPSFEPNEDWQQFIFQCARFNRLFELSNPLDFRWRYYDGKPEQRRVELHCINPSSLLAAKHQLVQNVVAFSATLQPWHYSTHLNGLKDAVTQQLPSPFSSQQHQVYIASDVSTRFRDRQTLSHKLQATLNKVITNAKNSMIFFSSYQQLQQCRINLQMNERCHWQSLDTSTQQRDDILQSFRSKRGQTLFAVLGGVFAEGIDLPGEQLEQVIIVGPGLPQVNELNNAIKQRMQDQGYSGFDFAYAFPGLQKVLQAAGRCVRTEKDSGEILLIDDRFIGYQQRGWLPDFWSVRMGPLDQWGV